MNRRRRNLLIQIGLGLSVGVVVPLAVIAVLLATGGDGEGTTVRISPSAAPAQPVRGLRATRGKELERFLLTPGELGSGWTVFTQGRKSGQSLDKAVSVVPEIPRNCSAFPAVQTEAFDTPWARGVFVNSKAGKSFVETVTVFRPGMAQETMAFLRGLVARCGKYDQKFKIGGRTGSSEVTTTVSAGPRLGEESLRIDTRFTYSGGFGGASRNESVYIRIGDTVLFCASSTGGLDALAERALAKVT